MLLEVWQERLTYGKQADCWACGTNGPWRWYAHTEKELYVMITTYG